MLHNRRCSRKDSNKILNRWWVKIIPGKLLNGVSVKLIKKCKNNDIHQYITKMLESNKERSLHNKISFKRYGKISLTINVKI